MIYNLAGIAPKAIGQYFYSIAWPPNPIAVLFFGPQSPPL
jgi:hypothetical protein